MSVLNASALPAYLFDKLGAPVVAEIIDAACISGVNLSEVLMRLVRDGIALGDFVSELHKTNL